MSEDVLHDWWCLYVVLAEDRPDLAAQVYKRIQELRRQEWYEELEQALEHTKAVPGGWACNKKR